MTTNQTIDGVPRELIQWLVDHEEFLDFGGRESDLRALLEEKPKAEPVAYLCKSSGSKWLQYGAKVLDPWRPEEVELTPLYAKQPAPVAVVLPELEPAFEKWWEEDGQYYRSGGGSYEKTFAYRAYEAALAEVTRLNPSL